MAKTTFLSWSQTAGNNQDIDGIGILGSNAVANFDNAFRTLMAQLRRDIDGKVVYANKSANYTAVADDNNAVHRFTAAVTVALTAAATLGDSWHYTVFADGGAVIIDPNASELINGATTYTVQDGNIATIICDGSAFRIFVSGLTGESLNGGPLGGFRNKVINGNFGVWQRGTSLASGTGYRYLADRWVDRSAGTTITPTRQSFALGSTLPPDVTYFHRSVVSSVAGFNNFALFAQPIESVRTLEGKTATLTFYAKADSAKNIGVVTSQYFGAGGSPTSQIDSNAQQVALTSSWQRFSILCSIPSISGKTLGTDGFDCLVLAFYFDAGGAFAALASNIGQQSGTFDIARVSLVEGDARQETDPFSPRHVTQEEQLCRRYYQSWDDLIISGYSGAGSVIFHDNVLSPRMRENRASPSFTINTTSVQNTGNVTVGAGSYQRIRTQVTITAAGYGHALYALSADFEL